MLLLKKELHRPPNELDDCIAWMKYFFPGEHWSVNIVGKSRTILDYLEHCKYKLSRRLGYCDENL